tara:strand:- start:2257 stop:3234 length:978 start_codon:yes stop_codon:yes gene_type:complete
MPGLVGSQGIRPGALNMGRIFRALRYRSEQAQYVTYHRLPIYETDAYGVPDGQVAGNAYELLLPDLPAIIRPAITADYQQERAGNNIIGAARIYTPNINTIKNYPNFDQNNNTNFNEIQGWDRLITNYRSILYAETDVETGWTTTNGVRTTDGESIINTLSGANPVATYTAPVSNVNILEADRLRIKIKPDFAMGLASVKITNAAAQTLTYTPTALTVTADNWLTLDLPYITGTVADNTSIYQAGVRYATAVTSSVANYNYESNLTSITITSTGGANANTVYYKGVEFYKSVSWHVHSLKDMTDGYIIFNCVRTAGRDDARRRAE